MSFFELYDVVDETMEDMKYIYNEYTTLTSKLIKNMKIYRDVIRSYINENKINNANKERLELEYQRYKKYMKYQNKDIQNMYNGVDISIKPDNDISKKPENIISMVIQNENENNKKERGLLKSFTSWWG